MTRKNTQRTPSWPLAAYGSSLLFLVACWGLPANFKGLSLDEKIKVYEHHIHSGGAPRKDACYDIASHGLAAADRIAEFLNGRDTELSIFDQIDILREIQHRGCSLKSTQAEKALRDRLDLSGFPLDRLARERIEELLSDIQAERSYPNSSDAIPSKLCQ